MNGLGDGDRRVWPIALAAFVTGLAVALFLPARDGAEGSARPAPAEPGEAPSDDLRDTNGRHSTSNVVRSREGAVQAAAAFVCNGQALLDMDPLAAEETLREASARASAEELVARHLTQLDDARDLLEPGVGPIVYRQSAVAWRVDAFDEDRARIAIWSVGVLSREGVAPPQAAWTTSVVELVWERDGWRVWGETITPGPTPIADDSDAPATSTELSASLHGFSDFGSAP